MPKDLVASDGAVAWSASHSAYGRIVSTYADPDAQARYANNPVKSPFRLLGQVADEDAELSWTRFRCFDPETGTWMSTDPLGLLGGFNAHAFDGSPAHTVDPLGLTGDPHEEMKWSEGSAKHALDRHSPHRPPGPDGKGTLLPASWSEQEFLDAVQQKANDPSVVRTPVPAERGGMGWTAYEPITINGETRKIFIVGEVPDPAIPGTGPGVITSAFPRHPKR